MDFLKSAVASAISKGPAFPYSFGDRVDISQSIWTLHNGTIRVLLLNDTMKLGANCLRKTVQLAVFSASISPPTGRDYPLLKTPSEN